MYCSNCGQKYDENARFCHECGAAREDTDYATQPASHAPQPASDETQPTYYAPQPAYHATQPAPYVSQPTNYTPQPTSYVARPTNYTPGPAPYVSQPTYYPPGPASDETQPTYYTPGPVSYAPHPVSAYDSPQTPSGSTSRKKKTLAIIITVAAFAVLLTAFACVYFFTDILPFNKSDDPDTAHTVIENSPSPMNTPSSITPTPTPTPVRQQIILPGSEGEISIDNAITCIFTPDISGTWKFLTKENGESDPYLEIFNFSGDMIKGDDDSAGERNAQIIIQLEAGTEYTINVGFFFAEEGSNCTLVRTYLGETLKGPLPETGGEFLIITSTEFVFTPYTSGLWEFRTSDNGSSDPQLEIFDSQGRFVARDDDSAGNNNALLTIPLDSRNTYSINAGFYYDNIDSFILVVTPIGDPYSDTLSGEGGTVIVNGTTEYLFTPEQTVIWEIRTSYNGESDPYLEVYNSNGDIINQNDDGVNTSNSNAVLVMYMQEGETYSICAGFFNSVTGNYTLTVSPCLHIPAVGGSVWSGKATTYVFVPDQPGTWGIRTLNSGESDPRIYVYDMEDHALAYDDDSGGMNDSYISIDLEAEKEYLIFTEFFIDETGGYELSVARE